MYEGARGSHIGQCRQSRWTRRSKPYGKQSKRRRLGLDRLSRRVTGWTRYLQIFRSIHYTPVWKHRCQIVMTRWTRVSDGCGRRWRELSGRASRPSDALAKLSGLRPSDQKKGRRENRPPPLRRPHVSGVPIPERSVRGHLIDSGRYCSGRPRYTYGTPLTSKHTETLLSGSADGGCGRPVHAAATCRRITMSPRQRRMMRRTWTRSRGWGILPVCRLCIHPTSPGWFMDVGSWSRRQLLPTDSTCSGYPAPIGIGFWACHPWMAARLVSENERRGKMRRRRAQNCWCWNIES
ncbi:hypothetical protein BDV33DRAFT_162083 [Aspergillus novoparasiticus]|uniref:Uncharacterized protein n=1 Tax=Aspergillus novoparasiticus TaxID=986946 RepID=A0A5N6F8V8_9EURO|nr:hypothetical protein BDV33DRAFT_162083 [Aspergillus novoparasiticus]